MKILTFDTETSDLLSKKTLNSTYTVQLSWIVYDTENLTQEQLKAVHRKTEMLKIYATCLKANQDEKRHDTSNFTRKTHRSHKTYIHTELRIYKSFYNV